MTELHFSSFLKGLEIGRKLKMLHINFQLFSLPYEVDKIGNILHIIKAPATLDGTTLEILDFMYDDVYPIEWNTVKLQNSANVLYPYNSGYVRISTLAPTVEELCSMAFTMSFKDDYGGTVYKEFTGSPRIANDYGHEGVYFDSTTQNYHEYFIIVPEGDSVPQGVYWCHEDYWHHESFPEGRDYCLQAPKVFVYDDEFPIQWNSDAVLNNTVSSSGGNIKVSNITEFDYANSKCTARRGSSVVEFVVDNIRDVTEYVTIIKYLDKSGQNIPMTLTVVRIPITIGQDYFPQPGLYYEVNGYTDFTVSVSESSGLYDDEYPIEWNMKAVEDNVKLYMDYNYIYSYGGLVFPECTMDTDTYPYNYLVYVALESKYYFYGTDQPLTYTVKEGVEYASYSSSIKRYKYTYGEDETWVDNGGTTLSTGFEIVLPEIVWTNTNVVDTNGEVKFEATEPVEVDKVPTMWLTKISNLTPTEEELLAAGISVDITYEGETQEYIFTPYSSDTVDGVSMCVYSDNSFTVLMYLISASALTEFEGVTIPSTGLYYMFMPVSGEVDFTDFDINFRYSSQQYIPSGGIVVTHDSVTEDSITHEINEDYYFPMVKISDAIMTVEDIRASSMVYRDSEGGLTVYHTLGDVVDSGASSNFRIRDWGCATDFNALYTQLISVSNPEEAGTLYNNSGSRDPVPFPETGTYVKVPDEGNSVETIMKFVPRYYNGVRLPAIDSKWHDRKTTPYAVISRISDTLYCLYILEKPTMFGPDIDKSIPCLIASEKGKYYAYLLNTETDDDWWFNCDYTASETGKRIDVVERDDILWSNHDILNTDGTVYLKGTNPSLTPMYLYGTPSETGNIGLRSGDTVIYYDGAVLPKLPEWDKAAYPYAYLATNGTHYLHLSTVPFKREVTSSYQNMIPDTNGSVIEYIKRSSSEVWERYAEGDREVTPYNGINHWSFVDIYWANFDVQNTDGTTHVTATEPIPVSPVGHSYNGYMPPEFPERVKEYPVVMLRKGNGGVGGDWFVYCCDSIIYRTTVSQGEYEYQYGYSYGQNYRYRDGEWTESTPQSERWISEVGSDYILWSNTDILYEDGTVAFAASDPIPIYDKE